MSSQSEHRERTDSHPMVPFSIMISLERNAQQSELQISHVLEAQATALYFDDGSGMMNGTLDATAFYVSTIFLPFV